MKISESEWQVMKVLWETPYLTMKEISANLDQAGWGYTTVRTPDLLARVFDGSVHNKRGVNLCGTFHSSAFQSRMPIRWQCVSFLSRHVLERPLCGNTVSLQDTRNSH